MAWMQFNGLRMGCFQLKVFIPSKWACRQYLWPPQYPTEINHWRVLGMKLMLNGQEKNPESPKWHQPCQRFQCCFTGWSTIEVSQHRCQHLLLSACVISDECLCIPAKNSSLFLWEEMWGKKPPANNILLEVDFPTPCPVQKYFYLIFCSEKRTHFRHLSSWGDMGQLLPWEGICVRAQAEDCSLTSKQSH